MEKMGIYHPLSLIYTQINARYFDGLIVASICLGRHKQVKKNTSSIRLGSYDPTKQHITIHPALDQAIIPRICIERVVHHEMLHQKHPCFYKNGRYIIHSKAFKEEEASFEGAALADRLIEQLLPRLLGAKITLF